MSILNKILSKLRAEIQQHSLHWVNQECLGFIVLGVLPEYTWRRCPAPRASLMSLPFQEIFGFPEHITGCVVTASMFQSTWSLQYDKQLTVHFEVDRTLQLDCTPETLAFEVFLLYPPCTVLADHYPQPFSRQFMFVQACIHYITRPSSGKYLRSMFQSFQNLSKCRIVEIRPLGDP